MVEERLLPSEYLERGWVKGILTDGRGRYCMLGAIQMWGEGRTGGLRMDTTMIQEFMEALDLGRDNDRSWNIARWNNASERTQAEVVERAKMAEVKLGLRCLADVVEPVPVPEVERLRYGLKELRAPVGEELELVGVGD